MSNEIFHSPEKDWSKFEQFFGSVERKEAFLSQTLSREDIKNPDFVFHLTNLRSIKARETGAADGDWFSFSKDAFLSLAMFSSRFLEKLSHQGFVITDKDSCKPIFIIGDYNIMQSLASFEEKPGLEKGHEVEIKMPFKELLESSLIISNSQEMNELVRYFSENTQSSEQKDLALRGLNDNLNKWQEVEELVQEKIEKE
jgi:hypothetical protein